MPNSSPIQSDNKSLDKNIVSTLLFYQILNVPCLTVFEIYRYLIKNSSTTANKHQDQINLSDICKSLQGNNLIKSKNGFYWLASGHDSNRQYDSRILAAKISAQKIKKAKGVSRLLEPIPFVKSIAISGSVSMDGAKPESDIDVFIISRKNRVWLARLATVFLTQIIGQRRHKKIVQDKICLNIYIAGEQSEYPVKNLANSQMITKSLPIYNKNIFDSFLSVNKNWLGEYIENFDKNFLTSHHSSANGNPEKSYTIIDFLEKLIGKILSARIIRNTPNAKPPFLLISDSALLFHYPRSKNAEVMEKYEKSIAEYENKI